jgi:hypothetical protein
MPNLRRSMRCYRQRLPRFPVSSPYLQEIAEHNAWMFSDREDSAPRLLKGFAASIANVMAVLS